MDYTIFEQAVARAAASLGITEYELYYQKDSSDEVSVFEGQIEKFGSSVSEGVCFRCICGGKTGLASTELFSEDEAENLVRNARLSALAVDEAADDALYAGGEYRDVEFTSYPGADTALDVEKALAIEADIKAADPRVEKAESAVQEFSRVVRLMNSHGLHLERSGSMAFAIAEAVASDGGETYSDYAVKTAPAPAELDEKALAARAVEKVIAQMGGKPVPSGSYPIIFSASQMSALLHIFSGAFSAKNAQDGLSRLAGKEGEKIAADIVTVVDDPFYAENCFKAPFDAEGVPACTKSVVENGVLKTLLHNLKTAKKAGVVSTGNASKASYAAPVGVAPFTFYLKPGSISVDELYAAAGEKAILITYMKGAHAGANPVTGDFSLESKGFLIENGKIARPVQGITVAGNFFDLMKNICALADDLEFDSGITSFGAPSTLVAGLMVAGE
ncbi:MAG: TldD/PmbA family protein [Oscillospiraceae bacterium]|nr:TldD/PmbA family protein [Oscillospiraceae bacterium]